MGKVEGLIRVLSAEEMQLVHEGALRILEQVGMYIDHQGALDYLAGVGCWVDPEKRLVRFPPKLVEETVARMKKDYATHREGRPPGPIPMRYSAIYCTTLPRALHHDFLVNTGGFPPYVLDLEGNRRPATLQDVRDSIRLADASEHIDLIGLPCSAQEIEPDLRPVLLAAELVKHTAKPGGVEAWNRMDVVYLSEIAQVVQGGEEELRQQPILVGYGEARSPLCLDYNMTDVFIEYIKRGLPQSLDTMPAAGTTAPATSAGTLTLGIAETLGGLVLGYAIDPQALVSLDVCPTLTAMESGIFPYAGADRIPLVAAACQMISEFYGRPGGCHGGKTDACYPGVQAGLEKALSILLPVLAGAAGVGTLGHLENAVTFSYQQLVIDNEIVRYIKRMLQGFEVNEEKLALEVVAEVGAGGNYLSHEHTAKNFRQEFWLSSLMERLPWEARQKQKLRGMEEKAKARAAQILATHHPQPLSEDQEREIDRIVASARRDYEEGMWKVRTVE